EIIPRLADPLPQLEFLFLGRLDVVDLVVAGRWFLVGQIIQRAVNLIEPVERRGVVAPALVIVKAGRSQQAHGQNAAHHKKQISLDPGHSYILSGFFSSTVMPNVNVPLASSGVMSPRSCVAFA